MKFFFMCWIFLCWGKSLSKPFMLYKGTNISRQHCLKKTCLAKALVDNKITVVANKTYPNGGVNPIHRICAVARGKIINVKDAAGNEALLCQFNDQSFIKAWDLIPLLKK